MIKHVSLFAFLLLSSFTSMAQSQVEYLEVTATPSESDTTQTVISFVVSVKDYALADDLAISLKNEENEVIYQNSASLSSWLSSAANRIEGSIAYLTIEAGTYPLIEKFTCTAYTLVNGSATPKKTFVQGTF